MCDECKNKYDKSKKESYKEYKKNRKDNREQKFYSSKEWIIVRDIVRRKYNNICLYSYYILHEIKYVDYIHHIIELKEDWDKKLDKDNLIPLSDKVHKIVHREYDRSAKDKKQMQELLRELKRKYEKEFGTNLKS
ncbi:HNH endonuclease domain protein [Clostridium botulinum A2 str. Kyoto]|uniref:HNH endonuclease domain protein n=2 Tax=Clostridium botulinum TaxID=1491 RepID=C1FP71_CLOBJ|nr:HNH endonuclease [Clostridium botulinum]ACO87268.1 HNH endonuclease domain protein [Clostridium botulinum A2 str. Kyoto]